jgi:hypothetical protein
MKTFFIKILKYINSNEREDLIIVFMFMFVILILSLAIFPVQKTIPDFGDYGSFIGGTIGTIFGGITVLLVYRTYHLQKSELVLSRKELELTRGQLGIQNFETTFFNMLNMLSKITKDLRGLKKKYAIDSFQEATVRMRILYHAQYIADKDLLNREIVDIAIKMLDYDREEKYTNREMNLLRIELQNDVPRIDDIYHDWQVKHPDDSILIEWIFDYIYTKYYNTRLSQYFRYINGIIDFINTSFPSESEFDENKRSKYSNILQTQLSSFELALLFYNCLTSYSENSDGERKLFEHVKKYEMVDNVDVTLLMNAGHRKKYKKN